MFQFTGFPSIRYELAYGYTASPCGFPHSDIHGSLDMCSSPWLFAAYHVFLRLLVPRHPPCALTCLTIPYSVTVSAYKSLFFFLQNLFFSRMSWYLKVIFYHQSLYEVFKVHDFSFISLSWWWRRRDSNSWPPACKAGALPAELRPLIMCTSTRQI